jgi:hypothetical protein
MIGGMMRSGNGHIKDRMRRQKPLFRRKRSAGNRLMFLVVVAALAAAVAAVGPDLLNILSGSG